MGIGFYFRFLDRIRNTAATAVPTAAATARIIPAGVFGAAGSCASELLPELLTEPDSAAVPDSAADAEEEETGWLTEADELQDCGLLPGAEEEAVPPGAGEEGCAEEEPGAGAAGVPEEEGTSGTGSFTVTEI